MAIAVGSKAPDFTLKTRTDAGYQDVRLSDNFGKRQTVLLFFPLAFSSTCTAELCDQSAGLAEYENLGATVIGISVDSPYAQQAWAKAKGIRILLVSDFSRTVIRDYDVVAPMFSGLGDAAARSAFVIGRDGVVKYAEQTPTPKDLPDFAAIKAALAS